MKPVDEAVAALVSRLNESHQELWQERAAVREHDGGQTRELAEAMALIDVIHMHPWAALSCWV